MGIRTFDNMLGRTIERIEGKDGEESLTFHAKDGSRFNFQHSQDCCEHVWIEDIVGDLNDLLDSPILIAEETDNKDAPDVKAEAHQWTFYRFGTFRGTVTVRFLGTSNGYYAMGVSYFETLKDPIQETPEPEEPEEVAESKVREETPDFEKAVATGGYYKPKSR